MTMNLEIFRTFFDYDNRYTAPLYGYKDAADYWQRNSSREFLSTINIPTLILNAKDDPFLGLRCYPKVEAETNPFVELEIPDHGGHVGFIRSESWLEKRAIVFFSEAY